METIDQIPIKLEIEDVKAGLRLKRPKDIENAQHILDVANPLVSAKAVFKVCYIEEKSTDGVTLEGIRLTSRVLRKNLEAVERVFPYVITLGPALEERANASRDLLEQYCLDVVGNIALRKARKYLVDELCARFALQGISYMAPGSLPNWPIEEQRNLFAILDGVKSRIGVSLTDSFLMMPKKSVSGIYFPTEVTFYNCQLCPRENCPGRRAGYDEEKAKAYEVST